MKQKYRTNIIQLSTKYFQSLLRDRSRDDFSQPDDPELMDTEPTVVAVSTANQLETATFDYNLLKLYKAIDMAG